MSVFRKILHTYKMNEPFPSWFDHSLCFMSALESSILNEIFPPRNGVHNGFASTSSLMIVFASKQVNQFINWLFSKISFVPELRHLTCFSYINPFAPNAPVLYPLKTSENLTVFRCKTDTELAFIMRLFFFIRKLKIV